MAKKNRSVARRKKNIKNAVSQNPRVMSARQEPQKPTSSQIASIASTWSAPIPPPSILAQYEELVPGSAAKIIETANNQAITSLKMQNDQNAHRIESEKIFLKGNERRGNIGQFFALLIAILEIFVAIVLALKHNPNYAATVATAVLVEGGVVWFLGGQSPRPDKSKG